MIEIGHGNYCQFTKRMLSKIVKQMTQMSPNFEVTRCFGWPKKEMQFCAKLHRVLETEIMDA